MTAYSFDDRNIQWRKFADFEHFVYSILNIDSTQLIIDVLFKFDANKKIFLHRHKAINHTFVVQGEHHIYKPEGEIEEIRPVGSYKSSPASDNPHRECGGDQGAVVLFSIRGSEGALYEILDDDSHLVATVTMQDLIELYKQQ